MCYIIMRFNYNISLFNNNSIYSLVFIVFRSREMIGFELISMKRLWDGSSHRSCLGRFFDSLRKRAPTIAEISMTTASR